MQRQTEEQRGKRACSLTASGSISKAMEGLVGGAAQGSADCRQNWTTALIPRSSGNGTHPTDAVCAEGAGVAWGSGRYKPARRAMRGQARSKTGVASLPHVKLAPMSAPRPSGERQEPLDAIASPSQEPARGGALFRELDILNIKWSTGDLPEECRFLLDTQLIFLKK